MFKHFTPPLKKFTNYLLLAAVLLAASCKKQQDNTQQEQIDPKQQKQIHAYQNGNEVKTISLTEFKKKVDLKTLGTLQQAFEKPEFTKEGTMLLNNEQTYEGFAIQTDSIKMLTANGHTSYIFPVKLASPRAISFQNLTIDQSAEGTKIFVNTYTPTKKWITDWKAGKAGKFDGDIEVVYLNSPTPTATQDKKVMTNSNGCSTTTYYYELPYNCASGQHGPNDAGCYLTGSDRAGVAFVYITVTNCDGAGGGGNTTPTPPGPYNPCDGVPTMPSPDSRTNMSAGAKVMNVPPTGCDPVLPPPPPREIKINDTSITNNPKINCLLQKLLGLNGNTANPEMTALLAAFTAKGFDVTFKVGTTLDTNSKAEASVNQSDPTQYYIVLNRNKISIESQMSWAKTLLHEAFHVQLIQKAYAVFGSTAINLWYTKPEKMTLYQLMDYMEMKGIAGNYPFFPIEHHEYMAENFEVIKDGLKSFSLANNINHFNFSDDYFEALAYEGLNGTHYYENKVLKDANGNIRTSTYNGQSVTILQAHYYKGLDLKASNISNCN